MIRFRTIAWAAGLSVLAGVAGAAPPRVVESTVEDGQDDVNPGLTEIRVTFDRPMDPTSWSVVGGGPTFPEVKEKPRWADAKTLVIKVGLQPDHEYWMSLNSDTFLGFRSREGREPAAPRPIGFKTRAVGAEPAATLTVERNRAAVAALRNAIDENYAYRDRLKVDWEAAFAKHGQAMEAAKTENQFARAAARLLREAEDGHVYVRAGGRTIGTHVNASPPNFVFQTLRKAVTDWREHDNGVISGRVGGGEVGYLVVSDWNAAAEKSLDEAFSAVKGAKGLIIDVRANGGGDEVAARRFAGRFVDGPKVYSKNRIRRDGKWQGPFDRTVEARPEAERYGGPVAVLVGPKVGSSCESFVLMMRESPRCRLVGGVTKGSSGNPKPHELGNGVTVLLSSWEDQAPDGTLVEGRGVTPDVVVKATPAELWQRDAVLEAGIAAARKGGGAAE